MYASALKRAFHTNMQQSAVKKKQTQYVHLTDGIPPGYPEDANETLT